MSSDLDMEEIEYKTDLLCFNPLDKYDLSRLLKGLYLEDARKILKATKEYLPEIAKI